uniref:Uncharacterized protein n=1 Tax=Arundo donax TaxID=35708 RepID=A0A0A8YUP1_ARUDO
MTSNRRVENASYGSLRFRNVTGLLFTRRHFDTAHHHVDWPRVLTRSD